MELAFLNSNIGNPKILLEQIKKERIPHYSQSEFAQFDPSNHKVTKAEFRPDKPIYKAGTECDAEGNPTKVLDKIDYVTRIAIPLQKLIVKRLATFISGGGCSLTSKPSAKDKPLLQNVKTVWDLNKLDFKNGQIVRTLLSECECAEIWYVKDASLKCRIYKPSDGYTFYPVFDSTGDMIAFAVENEVTEVDKKVKYTYIYTDKSLIKIRQEGGETTSEEPVDHRYGKIPVVYYLQDASAWKDVQTLIDRLETVISNFCDTNDYFAAPILAVIGEIMGLAEKGSTGKAVQLENGADAKYVTWTQVPEAIKFEILTLLNLIFSCTQCPNISFDELKSLGDLSGQAFDRIMIDGHLKAIEYHQGIYGEAIQRRLNFLISAVSSRSNLKSDLTISPTFRLFKINDRSEMIKDLLLANGNQPLMSRKDAVAAAELTDNVEETLSEIEADEQRLADLKTQTAGHSQNTGADGIAGSKTKTDNPVTKARTRMTTTNAQNVNK